MIKLIDPLLPGLSLKAVLTSIGSDYPLYSWSTQKLLDLYVSEVLEERNDTTPFHPPPPKYGPWTLRSLLLYFIKLSFCDKHVHVFQILLI